MKTILVTGATGLVGKELVAQIVKSGNKVYASSRRKVEESLVPIISTDELLEGQLPPIDIVVNCAFARSNHAAELSSALDFTSKLVKVLMQADVEGVINVSSQGVYKRLPIGEMSTEDSPIEPVDLYSMAKYATEKLFEASALKNFTNVRLSSINMKQRFLARFVESVKKSEPIRVNSPCQYASLLDVEDAANGLLSMALSSPTKWKKIYNLGIGKQLSLLEYAEIVKEVGIKMGYAPQIEVAENGVCTTAGMDISRIITDFGWTPQRDTEQIIAQLFKSN